MMSDSLSSVLRSSSLPRGRSEGGMKLGVQRRQGVEPVVARRLLPGGDDGTQMLDVRRRAALCSETGDEPFQRRSQLEQFAGPACVDGRDASPAAWLDHDETLRGEGPQRLPNRIPRHFEAGSHLLLDEAFALHVLAADDRRTELVDDRMAERHVPSADGRNAELGRRRGWPLTSHGVHCIQYSHAVG